MRTPLHCYRREQDRDANVHKRPEQVEGGIALDLVLADEFLRANDDCDRAVFARVDEADDEKRLEEANLEPCGAEVKRALG